MMRKSDILAILLLGETVALFSLPILIDMGLDRIIHRVLGFNLLLALPVFVPLAALVALFILHLFSRRLALLSQLGKFASVGVANTVLDIGVFSLLKLLTGTTFGLRIAGINMVGFSIAVVHSYLWNKYWTFGKKDTAGAGREFVQFLFVSVVGIFINSGIIYFLTTLLGPQFGLDKDLWATVAKIIATPISMTWNFVGYKLIVFRKVEADLR